MKRLIYTVGAAALLAGIATISFTTAQATITMPDQTLMEGRQQRRCTVRKRIIAIGGVKAPIERNTATSAASGC